MLVKCKFNPRTREKGLWTDKALNAEQKRKLINLATSNPPSLFELPPSLKLRRDMMARRAAFIKTENSFWSWPKPFNIVMETSKSGKWLPEQDAVRTFMDYFMSEKIQEIIALPIVQ